MEVEVVTERRKEPCFFFAPVLHLLDWGPGRQLQRLHRQVTDGHLGAGRRGMPPTPAEWLHAPAAPPGRRDPSSGGRARAPLPPSTTERALRLVPAPAAARSQAPLLFFTHAFLRQQSPTVSAAAGGWVLPRQQEPGSHPAPAPQSTRAPAGPASVQGLCGRPPPAARRRRARSTSDGPMLFAQGPSRLQGRGARGGRPRRRTSCTQRDDCGSRVAFRGSSQPGRKRVNPGSRAKRELVRPRSLVENWRPSGRQRARDQPAKHVAGCCASYAPASPAGFADRCHSGHRYALSDLERDGNLRQQVCRLREQFDVIRMPHCSSSL